MLGASVHREGRRQSGTAEGRPRVGGSAPRSHGPKAGGALRCLPPPPLPPSPPSTRQRIPFRQMCRLTFSHVLSSHLLGPGRLVLVPGDAAC